MCGGGSPKCVGVVVLSVWDSRVLSVWGGSPKCVGW